MECKVQEVEKLICPDAVDKAYQKEFQIGPKKIVYHNSCIISESEDANYSAVPFVTNHLCSQDGNKFLKLTTISFENRIIQISDTFYVVPTEKTPEKNKFFQENRSTTHKIKKLHILKRKYKIRQQHSKQNIQYKRDTKNIVKNIVKMFTTWLNLHSEFIDVENLTKQIITKKKFNNTLIKQLSENKLIKHIFLKFCEEDCAKSIYQSRINDKQSHLEALQSYIRVLRSSSHQNSENQNENFQRKQHQEQMQQHQKHQQQQHQQQQQIYSMS